MKINNKLSEQKHLWAPLLVLIILAAVTAVGVSSVKNINYSQYRERVENSNILMDKICNHVETAVDFDWERARFVATQLGMSSFSSMDQLFCYIKVCEESIKSDSYTSILLIDEDGLTYVDGEEPFRWMDMAVLTDNTDMMYLSDYQFASKTEMQMHYIVRLNNPITVDGITFTHVSLASNMSQLDRFFDVSNYGEESITFIIHQNGSQAYRQKKENSFSGVYNLLSALEDAKYNYDDSFEHLLYGVENGLNDTVHLTYKGKNYFAGYYKLDIKDWVVVLMVPEEYVGTGTRMFTRQIISSIVWLMICLLALLFIAFIVSIYQLKRKHSEVNDRLVRVANAEHQASRAKTDFLSSMSHDIRTPLNAIMGMVDIALGQSDNPTAIRECLTKAKLASEHLLTLINDILDIDKVESGRMKLTNEVFSLTENFNDLIGMMKQMSDSNPELHSCLHNIRHDLLCGDKLRLNQVFINILSNALKYTDENGKVWVDLYQEPIDGSEDSIRLIYVVKDTGMGISEKYQEIMYDSFSRAADSRISTIQGSGLGLSICKQLVELMGGTIECDSRLGVGTTFTVALELPIAQTKDSKTALDANGQTEQEFMELSNIRILIAEDNDLNWEIAHTLFGMRGIVTERAENGLVCTQLLESAEENYYSLVLMDVRMPVMDGRTATRCIRSSEKEWIRNLPVIAMTADAFAEDVQECLDAGMNEHISKPLVMERLLRIIKNLCDV